MNTDQARDAVRSALGQIAPEADLEAMDTAVDMRQELDLDSMDFLALVESLAESTGVEVPEEDYRAVRSLDGMVSYLVAHAA